MHKTSPILIAQRRAAALLLAAAALVSCSLAPTPTPSPSSAPTQAADMRSQLDLLLTEHVMIVVKESAAALNSSADYGAYATLLTTNEAALTLLMRHATGNTTADEFSRAWKSLNADLVDYAIRIATHEGDKADADTARLTATTMPALADQLAAITLGVADPFLALVTTEVTAIRDAINGAANHQYAAMYTSLGSGVLTAMSLGDIVAGGIVRRFADRFPGEQQSDRVARRVRLNVFLQERAYLITMATAAQLQNRPTEKTEAGRALASNLDFVAQDVSDPRLRQAWIDELTALQAYTSSGDAASRQTFRDAFVIKLAGLTKAPPIYVAQQVDATFSVIDDQRAKNPSDVAADDRAAATAMQPIADALSGVEG